VPALVPRLAPALAVVLMVLPAVATVVTAGRDDERRDQSGFEVMRSMGEAAVAEADRTDADRVTLVLRGRSAVLAEGSAVALQLESHGHATVLPEQRVSAWGQQRMLDPGDDPGDLILELVSGRGSVPAGPGRTIARVDMNEELRPIVDPLVDDARRFDPVPSAQAEAILAEHYPPEVRGYIRGVMGNLRADPNTVLTDDELVGLIAEGYYDAPTFDPEELAALQAALPAQTVNEDDVFELRVLTKADLAEVVPTWKGG
jgi:hypothetical protein